MPGVVVSGEVVVITSVVGGGGGGVLFKVKHSESLKIFANFVTSVINRLVILIEFYLSKGFL